MKIELMESGGMMGLVKSFRLDSADLSEADAKELKNLLKVTDLNDSASKLSDSARDLKQYDLIIDVGNRQISFTFDDVTLPAELKPLLGFLRVISQK